MTEPSQAARRVAYVCVFGPQRERFAGWPAGELVAFCEQAAAAALAEGVEIAWTHPAEGTQREPGESAS